MLRIYAWWAHLGWIFHTSQIADGKQWSWTADHISVTIWHLPFRKIILSILAYPLLQHPAKGIMPGRLFLSQLQSFSFCFVSLHWWDEMLALHSDPPKHNNMDLLCRSLLAFMHFTAYSYECYSESRENKYLI